MKFKKVVCIYPYLQEVPIYEFFPPIGLEYIASAIEDMVGEITVYDFRMVEDVKPVFKLQACLFCVSVNWNYEFESVCRVIRALPREATVVVGGRHATAYVEELFELCPNIDVIVRGDGEETMREYIASGSPEGIAGISYRNNGKIMHNDNRELEPISDKLLVNRNLRRYNYRISYQKVDMGYSFDSVIASRGCPFNCRFCSFKQNPLGQKRKYSERTPESVINELRQIDAKVVAFLDDNFFVNIKRAERICDLLIKEKMKKKFIVNARITIASHPELLKKMYLAGFRLLMMGVESAQDKSLKSLEKGFKTDDVRKAFKELRKSKMFTSGYFIIGLIGETKEEMLEIAPFAAQIGLDFVHLNRLRFEKYSGLQALLDENKDYYVGNKNRIYSKDYGVDEINKILKDVRNAFFNRRKLFSIIWKGIRCGFPGWKSYALLPVTLPRIIVRLINRKKHRKKIADKIRLVLEE
jgi:magnesium-protoporphyrin IX monomethyl ester (oxidative) cyclase